MATADIGELEAERDTLEIAIAEIKAQLRDARATARVTGEYADPQWYSSAEYALAQKGIEYNRICRELKRLRKEQTERKDRAWEQAFVRMAKQTLTEEAYDRLVALAWEETGGRS